MASNYIFDGTGLDMTPQEKFDEWIGELLAYARALEGSDEV